ncbi:NUDIX hydrolase [Actinomadura terrae]|uniref:NUDIX hydrolase n=1 Tax=Actinomadura terrae TaxID=604353 RepID=UPI001FA736A7|nr:NUDIX hydrolase [Actinomadura terrae]
MYGYLLCPLTARVLVQDDDGRFNPPGGTLEEEDDGWEATLAREAFEENQVHIRARSTWVIRRCTGWGWRRRRRCG